MGSLNDASVPHCGNEPAVQNSVANATEFCEVGMRWFMGRLLLAKGHALRAIGLCVCRVSAVLQGD
jgi:hypothetical protein